MSAPSGVFTDIAQGKDGEEYRVTDGESGTSVSCRVAGSDSYVLEGDVSVSRNFIFSVRSIDKIPQNGTGTARINEFHADSGTNLASPDAAPCSISTQGRFIDDGAIWATFDCPTFTNGDLVTCSASGTFIFENCLKD